MKTLSTALRTAIANGTIATFVKITTAQNAVFGFTNHDVQLMISGTLYLPTNGLERIVMNLRSNAEVSNQEFASAWVLDLPEADLASGKFDNSLIEVFKADWTTPTSGKIPVFVGRLGLIQWSVDGFRAEIHSLMRQLSKTIGYQTTAKCRHLLFSAFDNTHIGACGVNPTAFTFTRTVSTIVTQKLKFTIATLGQASQWAQNGIVTWTSGLNAPLKFEVKVHTSGGTDTIQLFLPTPQLISVGNSLTITAGCDKTFNTCKNKFNAIPNFGGFPHLRPEVNFK